MGVVLLSENSAGDGGKERNNGNGQEKSKKNFIRILPKYGQRSAGVHEQRDRELRPWPGTVWRGITVASGEERECVCHWIRKNLRRMNNTCSNLSRNGNF